MKFDSELRPFVTLVTGAPFCNAVLPPVSVMNVAEILRAELMVRLQLAPLTESHPTHPAKANGELVAAVNTIAVPALKLVLHVGPQLIPAGVLVTTPDPFPALDTVRTWGC